jgi:hypothetical protein
VAVRVTDDYEQTTLWRKGPTPWAGGPRTMFIAITPERITGRAVRGDG